MLERFSDNAKKMMLAARLAAQRNHAECIDSEHLLIGMLEVRDCTAHQVLLDCGIDNDQLLNALETMLPQGQASTPPPDPLPFAPSCRRILEGSLQIAAEMGHNHIGSHHLLVAIARDGQGESGSEGDTGASPPHSNDAQRILSRVGADRESLERAMRETAPASSVSRARLLLVSNSTMHGGGYLEHCRAEMQSFLGNTKKRVLFVPFALADHVGYADKARPAFEAMGHELVSAHTFTKKAEAVDSADAVFVGGGNTFRLLNALQHYGLLQAIRARVRAGMPYMGSSAGTNVATLSIRTTNDMPIVQPESFTALELVPFQINPHYLDPTPNSSHMGETREERILQFHEEHEVPVLGLREGCMLRVEGPSMELRGTTNARLFRRGQTPEEFSPPSDLSFLLKD